MNKLFSFLFIGCFATFTANLCSAQTTWVKTQNIDNLLPAPNHDSTTVGPKEMYETPNGSIISLLKINQNGDINVTGFNSLGNIIWNHGGSHNGGIYSENCKALKPTWDNGCVYIFEHFSASNSEIIYRLNASGTVVWSKTYSNLANPGFRYPIYVIPTNQNSFYVKFSNDSLVEFDDTGDTLRTRSQFSGEITIMPDSDFIVTKATVISRENFTGTQRWTLSAPGYYVIKADSSIVYAGSTTHIMKVNASDGSPIWSKPINASSKISVSSDGEFTCIGLNGTLITKYDSSGTLLWSKNFDFPNYGFSSILACQNKVTITGGCWRNYFFFHPHDFGYSPFLMNLDSAGNGAIDSTDYFFCGNANDNNKLSFADDAVYIAAAMNHSGPPRDNLLSGDIDMSVFAANWTDSFSFGANFKFSDLDGNGTIDTIDMIKLSNKSYSFIYNYPITPHWLRTNSSSLPELKLQFDTSYANANDTLRVYVTMGSTSIPADSIYGISMEINLYGASLFAYKNFSIQPSALGDPSSNLYSFSNSFPLTSGYSGNQHLVLCRTDHQNTQLSGDTIATLYFLLDNSIPPLLNTMHIFANYNVISKSGSSVLLNLVTDSLRLSGLTGIDVSEQLEFTLFPQPSDKQLKFSFSNSNVKRVNIFDSSGRHIHSINNPGKEFILDIADFSNGFYYATFEDAKGVYRSKFVVIH